MNPPSWLWWLGWACRCRRLKWGLTCAATTASTKCAGNSKTSKVSPPTKFSSLPQQICHQATFFKFMYWNADDCCRVIIHTPMTQHNLLLARIFYSNFNFCLYACVLCFFPPLSLSVVCIIPKITSPEKIIVLGFVLFWILSRSWEGGLLPVDEEGDCQRNSEARSGAQKSEEGERRCWSHHPTQKIILRSTQIIPCSSRIARLLPLKPLK